MHINRRHALCLFGATGLTATQAMAVTPARAAPLRIHDGSAGFRHGVASGDPGQHDVILWTRVTADQDPAGDDLAVDLEVATDPDFKHLHKHVPRLRAPAARDYTVKHLLRGLEPGRDYYYRFRHGDRLSPTGRTRTLPASQPRDLVLAVASCALWPGGYFNAYEAIARRERLDAVLHLGDYIYEYGAGPKDYGMSIGSRLGRVPDPAHQLATLADYRTRHAQYKTDPQLQAAHARAPWIVVWDDHEVANNNWHGGSDADPGTDSQSWIDRKAAALRAYYEWMPIREPLADDAREAACRAFRFGDLAELVILETRLTGREAALDYKQDLAWDGEQPLIEPFLAKLNDPDRHMLGRWQQDWLAQTLTQSVNDGVRWQILGNQVVMARVAAPDVRAAMAPADWDRLLAPLSDATRTRVERNNILAGYDIPSNLDSWDGYPAARARVYDAITRSGASVIALAGDSHMFWVNELRSKDQKRVAAEFATSSITSPSYGDVMPGAPIGPAFAARNPEVLYNDPSGKGFLIVTLTRFEARVDLVTVSSITDRQYDTTVSKSFAVSRTAHGGIGPIQTV